LVGKADPSLAYPCVETRIYPITFMIPSPSVTQIQINVTLVNNDEYYTTVFSENTIQK